MSKKVLVSSLSVLPIVIACGSKAPEIDPTKYQITAADRVKVEIPEACRVAYENVVPRIAVVDFANNTTFDLAKVVQSQSEGTVKRKEVHGSAWGVGVTPGGVGVGHVGASASRTDWKTRSQTVSRDVNAKLGESVAEAVVSELSNIGGMKIFTRNDLQKIMQEQKFQMSGLVDPNTAVQIGKLAGVKYIVTGAVNNINLKWVNVGEGVKHGLSENLGLVGTVIAAGASTQEGWNLTLDIVVKVIDVETGEVVLSKTVSGREVLGKTPTFNFDSIIGGAKKAAKEALEDIRPELSKLFPLRGYVLQLRTAPDKSSRYALINLGSKNGVKEGQEFFVIDFQEIQDPITGKTSCDQIKLPVTLVVSKQIQTDKSWTVVQGDKDQIMRVKIGQVVERKPLEGGSITNKLF